MGIQVDEQLSLLRNMMNQIGFTAEASLIYSYLLQNGPKTIDEVRGSVSTAESGLRNAFKELHKNRMINVSRKNNKNLYYLTDPGISWLAFVADLIWTTRVDISPIRQLANTDDEGIEQIRRLCSKVVIISQEYYEPHTAITGHKEHDTTSSSELAQLICECIYQAQNKILAVSKTPRQPQVSSFWAVLTDRISAGVKYNRIVDIDEFIDHGLKVVRRDIEDYMIDIRVLEKNSVTHKFYVIDNKYLCVFHQTDRNTADENHGFGRVTTQKEVITRFKDRFEKFYKKAIPAKFVIDYLERSAKVLLERAKNNLEPIEVAWLEDCVNYGKFSRFFYQENWPDARILNLMQKALATNLVRKNFNGEIVPNYRISEEEIREAYVSG